jgi:hypothetical protein
MKGVALANRAIAARLNKHKGQPRLAFGLPFAHGGSAAETFCLAAGFSSRFAGLRPPAYAEELARSLTLSFSYVENSTPARLSTPALALKSEGHSVFVKRHHENIAINIYFSINRPGEFHLASLLCFTKRHFKILFARSLFVHRIGLA